MRSAGKKHSSGVFLKPATAAIMVVSVAALCLLSFAAGTTRANAGPQTPALSATAGEFHIQPQRATDNVVPIPNPEPLDTTETAQLAPQEQPGVAETATDESTSVEEAPAEGVKWQTVRMRVTAYCPCPKCCGEYSDGITACGHKIRPGDTFVAADGRFAFYTDMVIEGYGNSQPVKVLDRGGAIKGNKLDVFFMTHQEALEWGVRYIDVRIRQEDA